MTNLLVPVFIWNGPPTHNITALIGIPSQSKIVTGSSTGTLCIWGTNFAENKIEPLFILAGQDSSPIIGLAVTKHELIEAVVGVTADGAVSISNLIDGQCIGYAPPGTLDQPTCIQMLNKRYLVCAGKSCALEIVDLVTRKVIRRITGHQGWILALTKCSIGDTPVLATMTRGTLRFYNSNVLFGRESEDSCLPIQQVMIEKPDGHALDVSVGGDLLLVLGLREFSIYLIKGSRLLLEVAIDDTAPIETGKWLKESDMLVVFTKGFRGHIYQIHRNAVENSLTGTFSATFLQCIPVSHTSSLSAIKIWCGDNKIIVGSGDGQLEVWTFPKLEIEEKALSIEHQIPSLTVSNTNAATSTSQQTLSPHPKRQPNYHSSQSLSDSLRITESFDTVSKDTTSPIGDAIAKVHERVESRQSGVNVKRKIVRPFVICGKENRSAELGEKPDGTLVLECFATGPIRSILSTFWECHYRESDPPFSPRDNNNDNSEKSAVFEEQDEKEHVQPEDLFDPHRRRRTKKTGGMGSSEKRRAEDGDGLADKEEKGPPRPDGESVTAVCLMEESFQLLEGLKNGSVTSRLLPFDPSPKTWVAHDARVTAVLVLSTGQTRREPKQLVTASEDFYVKVWDMDSQALLARFACHSGIVTHLFPAIGDPATTGKVWKNRFFSCAKDGSVILYQVDSNPRVLHVFGPHPDEIEDVRWVVQQDYLIVRCADKSISIWEMDSGRLEQRLFGETADEIYYNASPLKNYEQLAKHQQVYKKTLTGFTLGTEILGQSSGGRSSGPCLALVFNVRQWYFELQQHYNKSRAKEMSVSPIASLSSSSTNLLSQSGRGTNSNDPHALVRQQHAMSERTGLSRSIGEQHVVHGHLSLSTALSQATAEDEETMNETTSLPSFKAFSCLIPWHFDEELDLIVRLELLLRPPSPAITFGLIGHSSRFTIMVPSPNDSRSNDRRWTTSETMTGLHTLATACLSKALWNVGKNPNACIQVQSYTISEIPQRYPNFVNPSLSFLARYWHDQKDDVMETARSIFNTVIDRLGVDERLALSKYWSTFLSLGAESDNKSKSLAVLVLGILGCEKPDSLTAEISQSVAHAILEILFHETNVQLKISAVELFGKGYSLWSKYIKNINQVIIKIFKVSLYPEGSKTLQSCCSHALILIGSADPKQFLNAISTKEGGLSDLTPQEHSAALGTVGSLVKKRPVCLMNYLPHLADFIIRNLDPHVPYLRNSCFKAATTLINDLVKKYPMIDFHGESQRLVVGDVNGQIMIFDLTSATRFFLLEGNVCISAVAFSRNGKILASYCVEEGVVKLWRQADSFPFLNWFASSMTCYTSVRLAIPPKPLTSIMLLENIKLQAHDTAFVLTYDQNSLSIPYTKT